MTLITKHTHETAKEWRECPECTELCKDWELIEEDWDEDEIPLRQGLVVGSTFTL